MTIGTVFNIQRFSLQDGPGIRTTVFFKGCPLRCPWCSNPESQNPFPEIAHWDSLCNGCEHCRQACDLNATSVVDGQIRINRKLCNNCGKCVKVCSSGALKLFGESKSVDEVFEVTMKDEAIYRNSGGGVTASGGEPLMQSDFVAELFRRCREAGIHTTLETSGYAAANTMKQVLAFTDLVFYDLKHLNDAIHAGATGTSNGPVLNNVKIIAETGIAAKARIPLVPGFNDSEEQIKWMAEFVGESKAFQGVDLLPYHRFGEGKYKMLDRPYQFEGTLRPDAKQVDRLKSVVESFGLDCEIVD